MSIGCYNRLPRVARQSYKFSSPVYKNNDNLSPACLSSSVIKFLLRSSSSTPNHSFEFIIHQSMYQNFLGIFPAYSRPFSSLFWEHNLIFRCSNISFHELQILYLVFSCSKMSQRISLKFSELSEYFSRLKYQFWTFLELFYLGNYLILKRINISFFHRP
jgi:hypothetical protein